MTNEYLSFFPHFLNFTYLGLFVDGNILAENVGSGVTGASVLILVGGRVGTNVAGDGKSVAGGDGPSSPLHLQTHSKICPASGSTRAQKQHGDVKGKDDGGSRGGGGGGGGDSVGLKPGDDDVGSVGAGTGKVSPPPQEQVH